MLSSFGRVKLKQVVKQKIACYVANNYEIKKSNAILGMNLLISSE